MVKIKIFTWSTQHSRVLGTLYMLSVLLCLCSKQCREGDVCVHSSQEPALLSYSLLSVCFVKDKGTVTFFKRQEVNLVVLGWNGKYLCDHNMSARYRNNYRCYSPPAPSYEKVWEQQHPTSNEHVQHPNTILH